MRIAVLVSGSGSNLQALIDAQQGDRHHADASIISDPSKKNSTSIGSQQAALYEIALVIADRKDTYAIERARKAGIPTELTLPQQGLSKTENRLVISNRVLELAKEFRCEALVLAGFLTILSGPIIEAYSQKILNLHPALLPKYGGQGMWGHHVHQAVLQAGETESGCTIHLVDAGCDTGPILLQRKVPVLSTDTPETLAQRISGEEHIAIVQGVCELAKRLAP